MSIVHFCGTWDLPESLAERFRKVDALIALLSANRTGLGPELWKAKDRLVTSMRCACKGMKWATAERIDADLLRVEHMLQREVFQARRDGKLSRKPEEPKRTFESQAERMVSAHLAERMNATARRLP